MGHQVLGLDPAWTSCHTCSIVCLASICSEGKGGAICFILPFLSVLPWGVSCPAKCIIKASQIGNRPSPCSHASLPSWLICWLFKLASSSYCLPATDVKHGDWMSDWWNADDKCYVLVKGQWDVHFQHLNVCTSSYHRPRNAIYPGCLISSFWRRPSVDCENLGRSQPTRSVVHSYGWKSKFHLK